MQVSGPDFYSRCSCLLNYLTEKYITKQIVSNLSMNAYTETRTGIIYKPVSDEFKWVKNTPYIKITILQIQLIGLDLTEITSQ